MRIAVDAMGSDNFPAPDVAGAILAAQTYGDHIILIGDEARIQAELAKHSHQKLSIDVHHTPQYIAQDDSATDAARNKSQSPMHLGLNMVKNGEADAFVTAGNTGAAYAVATLYTLKRIKGVNRPALATILPLRDSFFTLIDFGANADCKPEWLVQFAHMGNIYVQRALGIASPRIGLLSIGEEEGKGNQLTRETHTLLKTQTGINYIGNVEPKEVFAGQVDLVVSDGFTINVFGKTMEAVATSLIDHIRTELKSSLRTAIGGALAMPAFRRIRDALDPMEVGGVPLLGVNGVMVIAHGRTDANGMKNAIRQARQAVEGEIVEVIRQKIAEG